MPDFKNLNEAFSPEEWDILQKAKDIAGKTWAETVLEWAKTYIIKHGTEEDAEVLKD